MGLQLGQLLGVADLGVQLLDGVLLGLHAGVVFRVVVVVRVDVSPDSLIGRGGVLVPGLVDEFVGVHGLEAVLLPVGVHHLHEFLSALDAGDLFHDDGVVGGGEEELLQGGDGADIFLHLPQGLEGVPVAVLGGNVDLTDEHVVGPGCLGGVGEVGGRLELGQIDDPVDAERLALHVQDVLHVDHDLRQALMFKVEVQDGVLHVLQAGDIGLVPAVHEGVGIDGHDLGVVVEHGTDLVRVHFGGHHGGIDIAADLLSDPGLADGCAEALVHIGAVAAPAALGIPPAADVEVQRGDGIGAVQVVVEPHQALLGLVLPFDGEAVVRKFSGQDLGSVTHLAFSFSDCIGR